MGKEKLENTGNVAQQAIAAWKDREGSGQALTTGARSRVLREAVSNREIRSMPRLSSLFPSYHKLAAAVAIPVGLVALVVAFSMGGGRDAVPASVTVEKVGSQVVFNIANGGTVHSVSKSNTPHSFDPGNSVRVQNGSYRDSLIESGDLVFYRID